MNVILIGYRGCGKTSVGQCLAERLGQRYFDVDRETCRRFDGLTIAEIWQRFGESAWRQREAEVTAELVARPARIIGLGGGTLMVSAARQAVVAAPNARRVYLRCDPQELHRRIRADADTAATRPSLTALGGGLEEIAAVLAEREPVYREVADVEIDVTHLSVEDAAARVMRAIAVPEPGATA